ncbi:MAG: hypothetical protein LBC07_00085 [Elusimicrobiota bacterium]|jgi:hypothetical protein|nr:hypothetical protein [Elusimicrobiota bacterium]
MQLFIDARKIINKEDLERYDAGVGITARDFGKPEYIAKNKLKSYAGGPARVAGRRSKKTIGRVAGYLEKKYRWVEHSADTPGNKELNEIAKALLDCLADPRQTDLKQRYLNACRAVVRNPILRKEYPANKISVAKRKKFNRSLIDTATFFKTIKAEFINKNGRAK